MTQEQIYRRFYKTREKMYVSKIERALQQQYRQYLTTGDLTKVTNDPIKKVLTDLYWDSFRIWSKKMKTILNREEKKALENMGFAETLQQAFRNYFAMEILNTSQKITETTINIIKEILSRFVESGFNINDAVKEITDKADISEARARLIARTETTSAANAGAYYSALNSRVKMEKIWISTADKRTRKDHVEVNMSRIDLTEPFNVGDYEMLYPGDKGGDGRNLVGPEELCNCRCTVAFYPKRDSSGRLMLKPKP